MKIGFFDSGLGGLILLKATAKALPGYDYFYYGDTANLPYGDKTEEEIDEYSKTAMEHLFEHDCALVIIACNTASAETLRKLQDEYLPNNYPERRILGVIIPTIEALNDSGCKDALLIATRRTVDSKKYEKELLLKGLPDIRIDAVATPHLVPLIERGEITEAVEEAEKIIQTRPRRGDSVILGCTHYTLLKDNLREKFSDLTFISQDEVIPNKLSDYLNAHGEIETKLSRNGKRQIFLTEHRPDYDQIMSQMLGGVYLPADS